MRLLHSYSKLFLTGAALTLLGAPLPGRTDPVQNGQSGPMGAAAMPSPSKLQVSGTTEKFSVEADHADVQSAIKLLFDQAKLQFTLDSSVTGQLTLRLTDQPLDVTLKTLCKQTFLKYRLDAASGIYTFSQDTDAIKEAFTHLRSLNAELRQQLRALGLEVPGEGQIGVDNGVPGARNGVANQTANGFGGGGTGRRGSSPGDTATAQPGKSNTPDANLRDLKTNYITPEDLSIFGAGSQKPLTDADRETMRQFLRQNNLVTINTQGQEVAVADVFVELQKQSNIALLLDPDIPRGPKFRMQLTLRPTTLPDALNLLCPALHLIWRNINNAIFITPTSDFQIFWGNSSLPRVSYGPYSQQTQRGGYSNTGQGAPNGGLQGPGGPGGQGGPGRNPNPKPNP